MHGRRKFAKRLPRQMRPRATAEEQPGLRQATKKKHPFGAIQIGIAEDAAANRFLDTARNSNDSRRDVNWRHLLGSNGRELARVE